MCVRTFISHAGCVGQPSVCSDTPPSGASDGEADRETQRLRTCTRSASAGAGGKASAQLDVGVKSPNLYLKADLNKENIEFKLKKIIIKMMVS